MKNYILITILFLSMLSMLAAFSRDGEIAIRQGANIEWFRSSATLSDGAVYAWSDTRDGARDLYAQYIGSNGQKLWGENGLLVDSKPDRQEDPVIIGTTDNCAIIAWVDFSDDPDGNIYAQKINAQGVKQWAEGGVVLCNAQKIQISLNIVPDNAGGAYVIWNDQRSIGKDIYCQRISATGQVLFPTNGIKIGVETGTEEQHTLWEDGQGGAIIGYIYKSDQSQIDIQYARISPDGTLAWGPLYLTNDVSVQINARVVPDNTGGFIFAWDQKIGESLNNSEVFMQRININGQKLWGDNGINITNNPLTQERPRLTPAEGGAWIVWEDKRNENNTTADLYLQKVNTSGDLLFPAPGVVLCQQPEDQVQPRISNADNGSCVVVWEDARTSGDVYKDIYAQKVLSNGTVAWEANGRPICIADGKQDGASVRFANNKIFMIWADYRTGSLGLYQQVLQTTGTSVFPQDGAIVFYGLAGNAENLQHFSKNGLSYIVWDDSRYGEKQTFLQIVNNDQVLFEENGIPVTISDAKKEKSKAIVDNQGNIVIIWMENIEANLVPKAQKISPAGQRLWGDDGILLSQESSLNSTNHILALCEKDGSYYFYWNDTTVTGVYAIKGQKITNNQLMWGANAKYVVIKIDENDPFSENNIETTLKGCEDNYIIWNELYYDERQFDLYLIKVDENGDPATGWNTGGTIVCNAPDVQEEPNLYNTPDGLIAIWLDKRNPNNSYDIYAQIYAQNGVAYLPANGVPLVEYINDQNEFNAVYGNGKLNLVWKDFRNPGNDNYDIYSQRFTFNGSSFVPEWTVNGIQITTSDSAQAHPDVALMHDRCLVVWEDAFYEHNIRMGMIDQNGQVMPSGGNTSVDVTNHIKNQSKPIICKIDNINAYVAWIDGISSGKEEILGIYMKKINTSGFTANDDIININQPVALYQNYPNPFNPVTKIQFSIMKKDRVVIDVYNIKGQKVKTLMNDVCDSGKHSVIWNGLDQNNREVSSGVYYYRVKSGNFEQTKKMVLVK